MTVKTESVLLLVNYATGCVPVATYTAWILVKITFAGELTIVSSDILQKRSLEISTLVIPCARRVYAKFKQNLRPSKRRLLAGMAPSSIRK